MLNVLESLSTLAANDKSPQCEGSSQITFSFLEAAMKGCLTKLQHQEEGTLWAADQRQSTSHVEGQSNSSDSQKPLPVWS